jgi:hypothetical protein
LTKILLCVILLGCLEITKAAQENKNNFHQSRFLFEDNKTKMSKFELLKQLEYLIAFQTNCLASGDWDSFDRTEDKIKEIEEQIVGWSENVRAIS